MGCSSWVMTGRNLLSKSARLTQRRLTQSAITREGGASFIGTAAVDGKCAGYRLRFCSLKVAGALSKGLLVQSWCRRVEVEGRRFWLACLRTSRESRLPRALAMPLLHVL